MLADRLDAFQRPPVDRTCDARRLPARVRRRRGDAVADEGLEPERRAVERVAFGHGPDETR